MRGHITESFFVEIAHFLHIYPTKLSQTASLRVLLKPWFSKIDEIVLNMLKRALP